MYHSPRKMTQATLREQFLLDFSEFDSDMLYQLVVTQYMNDFQQLHQLLTEMRRTHAQPASIEHVPALSVSKVLTITESLSQELRHWDYTHLSNSVNVQNYILILQTCLMDLATISKLRLIPIPNLQKFMSTEGKMLALDQYLLRKFQTGLTVSQPHVDLNESEQLLRDFRKTSCKIDYENSDVATIIVLEYISDLFADHIQPVQFVIHGITFQLRIMARYLPSVAIDKTLMLLMISGLNIKNLFNYRSQTSWNTLLHIRREFIVEWIIVYSLISLENVENCPVMESYLELIVNNENVSTLTKNTNLPIILRKAIQIFLSTDLTVCRDLTAEDRVCFFNLVDSSVLGAKYEEGFGLRFLYKLAFICGTHYGISASLIYRLLSCIDFDSVVQLVKICTQCEFEQVYFCSDNNEKLYNNFFYLKRKILAYYFSYKWIDNGYELASRYEKEGAHCMIDYCMVHNSPTKESVKNSEKLCQELFEIFCNENNYPEYFRKILSEIICTMKDCNISEIDLLPKCYFSMIVQMFEYQRRKYSNLTYRYLATIKEYVDNMFLQDNQKVFKGVKTPDFTAFFFRLSYRDHMTKGTSGKYAIIMNHKRYQQLLFQKLINDQLGDVTFI